MLAADADADADLGSDLSLPSLLLLFAFEALREAVVASEASRVVDSARLRLTLLLHDDTKSESFRACTGLVAIILMSSGDI